MDNTRKFADAVLAGLKTQQGFREWWATIDPEMQNKIMEAIGTVAIEAFGNSEQVSMAAVATLSITMSGSACPPVAPWHSRSGVRCPPGIPAFLGMGGNHSQVRLLCHSASN
ncbi:hypothetical protein [Microvirga zambiensis]|uniref:hypothetical protein n=1 Tax=Microvirga zambiensis TaxID=1402137 RepID=UPI00191E7301|nr:hypothetical protein [Microvirga zambiensis]